MKETYNIALIEDCTITAELLIWELGQTPDYTVTHFKTGEAFFSHSSDDFDLAILDYNLNGKEHDAMNGLEITNRLKTIPKIVMSSQQDITNAVKVLKSGACDYIIKDHELPVKVDKSVKDVLNHLREIKEIRTIKTKSRKRLSRIFLMLLIVTSTLLMSIIV